MDSVVAVEIRKVSKPQAVRSPGNRARRHAVHQVRRAPHDGIALAAAVVALTVGRRAEAARHRE
jgi:hypothetical protein